MDYDGLGRMVAYTDFEGGPVPGGVHGSGGSWQRPGRAPLLSNSSLSRDPYETRRKFDALGRLSEVSDEHNNRTEYDYNAQHRPKMTSYYPNGYGPPRRTWMTYDRTGELAWSLDEAGNQSLRLVRDGGVRTFDANVTLELSEPTDDPIAVVAIEDKDLSGRLESMRIEGSKLEVKDWSISHNGAGDLVGVTYPDGPRSDLRPRHGGMAQAVDGEWSFGRDGERPHDVRVQCIRTGDSGH